MDSRLLWRWNAALAVLGSMAGIALAPTTAAAKVYFTADLAGGGTGVERAGFDGSELETLQFQPTGFEDDLALDVPDGRMYWTDTFASVIASANMNGSDPRIVVDDFGAEPLGIALDVGHGKMYWTDRHGVERANLNGGEQELLTTARARGFIALDLVAQRMYWADRPSGHIKTAAMEANPVVTSIAQHRRAPFGVAVDHSAGKVYWLELSPINKIVRANLDGSAMQPLVERHGAGFDGGFAIDPSAGQLYWSETEARQIGVSDLDGSNAHVLFTTGLDNPEGLAVETSDPHPANTIPPFIEGTAQVGSTLVCQPGVWSATGPVSLSYQWTIAGGTAIEGATASTYVPSAEVAGQTLACVVSASDDIATSTATSAALIVAPFPSTAAPSAPSPEANEAAAPVRLIAGISVSRLTVSGSTARVPVFTSLAGEAKLWAVPSRWPHGSVRPAGRMRASRRPPTRSSSQQLAPGRSTITLRRLHPNTTYRLVLEIRSGDQQLARDVATLRVQAR
jgi:hypothetical protein